MKAQLGVHVAFHAIPAECAVQNAFRTRQNAHDFSGSAFNTPTTPALKRFQFSVSNFNWRLPSAVSL
jgi:hypothetical protein